MKDTFDIAHAMLQAFSTSDRINEYLLAGVPNPAWNA
jgi:hypothetical protein